LRGWSISWLTPSRATAIGAGFALLVAAIFGLSGGPVPGKAKPFPQAGRLDLTRWDFRRDGSVPLAGQWIYFDSRFVQSADPGMAGAVETFVPGPWPAREAGRDQVRRDGFGTYVLKLSVPDAPDGDAIGIDTGQIQSAYRLYANGKLIAAPGMPGATAESERANSYSKVAEIPAGMRDVSLILQISNHVTRYGGIFIAPKVGLKSALDEQRHFTEGLSLLIIGALFFAACYHIAFLPLTRAGFANFWYGILAALFGGRMFFFEPLASLTVPIVGQDWVWRLDIAATDMLVPAAYWLLALSFPRLIARSVGYGLTGVCAVLTLADLGFGPVVGEFTLKTVELLAAGAIVYLTQAIVRTAWNNEQGAALALVGWIAVSLGAFHDMMIDNEFIAGPNLLPVGCVVFFLCLSGALTQRSHQDFVKAELLVGERDQQLHEKIAELERNQRALERARYEAVTANVAKSRFLANMSHELRTPLNAILGFSEVIRDRMFGTEAGARYADYASNIHASGNHLLRLINDILDLSKIEAGKLELTDAQLDLSEEARAAMRLLEPQARRKNVRLSLEMPLPLRLTADERAIRQVLVNLLSNAVKFTLAGGTVTLSLTREKDRATLIAVKDNGIGIKPEDVHRIFENFGQGRHDIRSTDESGTGLGLPIAKGLVEAMGGRIDIESKINIGTTVTVVLPPKRALDEARAHAA
jgi:signal transduction histidine kinase